VILAALVVAQACTMPPAALGDVLWLVQPPSPDREMASLGVVMPSSDDDSFTPLRSLSNPPLAMAATGSTVWAAVASSQPAGGSVALLALRADWDPRLENWLARPAGGMDRLPDPGLDTAIKHLVASAGGPIVIGSVDADGVRPVAALRRGSWKRLPDLPAADGVSAAVAVEDDLLVLLKGVAGSASIWRCQVEGGHWTETRVRLDGEPHDLLATDTGVLVGSQLDADSRSIGILQDQAVVPWIQLQGVSAGTRLLSGPTGLVLYRYQDETPWVAAVDRATGLQGPWRPLSAASGMGTRVWSILISVFIGLAVVFVLFIGRGAGPSQIPKGAAAAPLLRRGLGFAIDLVPGVLVGVIAMDVTSVEVLSAALTGPIPSTAMLLLLVAAVTAAWCILWEGPLGRTPGKRAVGLVTIDAGGGPMRWWQVLTRNLFKGLIVLAPPLAIIVVLTPSGQSLGDVVAKTLVLIRRPPT
jgi:uncharacterized RDD family membrane protein YckC